MYAATLTLPSALYVERGLTRPGDTHESWAREFALRGGKDCRITRPDAPVGQSPGAMLVAFRGSAEALDLLTESGCTLVAIASA